MTNSKLNQEITSVLVDTLPKATTLEELRKICSSLVKECNSIIQTHQSENILTVPVDKSESLSILKIETPLKPCDVKIIQLPIDISKITNESITNSLDCITLINFINSEMINCEISKSIKSTDFYYNKYIAWCKLNSIKPITYSKLKELMLIIGFYKMKFSGTQKFVGIMNK